MHGVRDPGLLKSAVAQPRATFAGKDLYPGVFHKAAALMESLILNHPFVDGNKRTAISAAGLILLRNGYEVAVSQESLEKFTMDAAMKTLSAEATARWFRTHARRRRG
jgi:death-on-curing protein